MRAAGHRGKVGRPVICHLPVEFRELEAWGKPVKASSESRKGEETTVVQLEFPLDHLPAYFPDPLRQECFMVRHD